MLEDVILHHSTDRPHMVWRSAVPLNSAGGPAQPQLTVSLPLSDASRVHGHL